MQRYEEGKTRKAYLVKVGLQEVDLLRVLQETGPVLELELLLAQDQLNLTVGVVDLAVLGVDLSVEVQGDGVCDTLARSAGERDIGRSDAQLGVGLRDIGGLQVHVEVVPLRIGVGGALSPCDCNPDTSPVSDRVLISIIYELNELVEHLGQRELGNGAAVDCKMCKAGCLGQSGEVELINNLPSGCTVVDMLSIVKEDGW
jgi:hypothetical protein